MVDPIPHPPSAASGRMPVRNGARLTAFGKYLAPWVLAGFALPLALPWLWNLPKWLIDVHFPVKGLSIGNWIIMLELILWPGSVLFWDSGPYMPVLLQVSLFWEAVGLNVLLYILVGGLFWCTRTRFRWMRYLVHVWAAVCLCLGIIGGLRYG